MFAKKNRYSFKRGLPEKVYSSPFFVARYQKNNDTLKVAVVTGKKIDKRSTIRNKAKRRFIESLKKEIQEKDIKFDLVFYLRKPILDQKEKVQIEIQKLLKEKIYG